MHPNSLPVSRVLLRAARLPFPAGPGPQTEREPQLPGTLGKSGGFVPQCFWLERTPGPLSPTSDTVLLSLATCKAEQGQG